MAIGFLDEPNRPSTTCSCPACRDLSLVIGLLVKYRQSPRDEIEPEMRTLGARVDNGQAADSFLSSRFE
jgi:hypothetical protein